MRLDRAEGVPRVRFRLEAQVDSEGDIEEFEVSSIMEREGPVRPHHCFLSL
jgi:hypothetical protein